jgi:hypothetical protein
MAGGEHKPEVKLIDNALPFECVEGACDKHMCNAIGPLLARNTLGQVVRS